MDRMSYGWSAVKEYARDYILENTGLKVLALFMTAVLWLSVASRWSQITLNPVPIEIINLSPELALTKYETLSAKVYLRGPKDVVDSLRSTELAVVADLQNVEPGVRVIPLKIDTDRLPPSIDTQTIDISPHSVRVTLERLVEANLPVEPRFEGEVAAGYEIYNWTISPHTIKVSAAASHIKDITSVLTETINIAGKTAPFSDFVAIDTGSQFVNTIEDSPKVMLTVNIGEVRKERVLEKIPVNLINAPANTQYTPKFVRLIISGTKQAVDDLKPEELEIIVDYLTIDEKLREGKPEVKFFANSEKLSVKSIQPSLIKIN
ncbi:MAG: CdaR family protein [Acidobacteriota bacterium]